MTTAILVSENGKRLALRYTHLLILGPFTWKEDYPSARIILGLGSSEHGIFSAFSSHVRRCICPSAERKGPFTWKEDDPKARIILEGSFGLHAKMPLCYVQDLCSAWLQSKMAGDNDKSRVLGVVLFLLALSTAFQHQFAIIIMIFQRQ